MSDRLTSPFTLPLLLLVKPVVLFIDSKDNSKELHNFIYLSKQCNEVHTPFSSKAQILKLSCLVYVGVNFIKENSTEILNNNQTYPLQLKPTNSDRELREVIFTSFSGTLQYASHFVEIAPILQLFFPYSQTPTGNQPTKQQHNRCASLDAENK